MFSSEVFNLDSQVFMKNDNSSFFKKSGSNKVQEIFLQKTTIYEFEIIEQTDNYLWIYDDIRKIQVKLTANSLLVTWKAFWRKKTDRPLSFEWYKFCGGQWVSKDVSDQLMNRE